jgi:hypothetical protein
LTVVYTELCRRTRESDRSLREKVMPLEEAAALVPDGASVGIGGSTLSRTPTAIWRWVCASAPAASARPIHRAEASQIFSSHRCRRRRPENRAVARPGGSFAHRDLRARRSRNSDGAALRAPGAERRAGRV